MLVVMFIPFNSKHTYSNNDPFKSILKAAE